MFVGVIAVGGLLLYLEARSRTRVSGYVMARRLGLARARATSVAAGRAGRGRGRRAGTRRCARRAAVAVVYRRLDVDLVRPPTPLLDVPWVASAVHGARGTGGRGPRGALYAQRAADRADPATVLREDA